MSTDTVVEAFDDKKAKDIMACTRSDVAKQYIDGTSIFLLQNHNKLVSQINNSEIRLKASRLAGDMKAYKKEIIKFKQLWIQGCVLHKLRVEELSLVRQSA